MMFLASTVWAPWSFVTSIRPPPNDVDFVLTHQELDALRVLTDDFVLFIENAGVIQTDVFAIDALGLGILEILPNVGGMKKAFSRNTPY